MADTSVEEKEKAEKLAAAKKKYEQLKKQKAKASGGATTQKKGKAKVNDTKANDAEEQQPGQEGDEETVGEATKSVEDVDDTTTTTVADEVEEEAIATEETDSSKLSISEQSKIRSESFRRGSSTATSPPPPAVPPGDAVQDIYRKQASRIELLEKENKRLEQELQSKEVALGKTEEEAEQGREVRGELVDLKARAAKVDQSEKKIHHLETEISSLQRQNTQLQNQAKRRTSANTTPTVTSPGGDIDIQLANKNATIESLELEISNLRHSLSVSQASNGELTARNDTLQKEIDALRNSSSSEKAAGDVQQSNLEALSNANNRIARLEADLQVAQANATHANSRTETLTKKIETITSLHRESEHRVQSQASSRAKEVERLRAEGGEMRKRLAVVSNENARLRETRARSSSTGSVDGEESEKGKLMAKIRELEGEIFDLKRGVWRERRKKMQEGSSEGGDDDSNLPLASPNGSTFDEVDLDTPLSPGGSGKRSRRSSYGGLAGVWNAFTGGGVMSPGSRRSSARHQKQQSRGYFAGAEDNLETLDDLDDIPDFDENAFRAAQEEEAKRRLEKVREIKRGLKEWEGWRVDLVDVRGGEMAGVFDV